MFFNKTLYRQDGYIKFCHKSLLLNIKFSIFFMSLKKQRKNKGKFIKCYFSLIFEGYKKIEKVMSNNHDL